MAKAPANMAKSVKDQQINIHVSAIVESAREQSVGIQEINTAVNTIDQGTQQNAAMVIASSPGRSAFFNSVVKWFSIPLDCPIAVQSIRPLTIGGGWRWMTRPTRKVLMLCSIRFEAIGATRTSQKSEIFR